MHTARDEVNASWGPVDKHALLAREIGMQLWEDAGAKGRFGVVTGKMFVWSMDIRSLVYCRSAL